MPALRFRIILSSGLVLGPGKAELLDGIVQTGSISAAGRAMRMSYKKAWQLVDQMNHGFPTPLVVTTAGGAAGGGAALTDLGREVLALFRSAEADALAVAADRMARLDRLARPDRAEPAKAGDRLPGD